MSSNRCMWIEGVLSVPMLIVIFAILIWGGAIAEEFRRPASSQEIAMEAGQ